MTSSPLPLSHAATFALPLAGALMALIRAPTVSVPVDVYVVVLVPSLTEIFPPARIPRVNSDVVAVSGAVPVPIAGEGAEEPAEFELEDDADEPVELLDAAEVELPALPVVPWSTFWIAAVSWELTRSSAVWFAMLARPDDSVVIALPMTLMRASLCAWAWLARCERLQNVWSCCQNETLPTLMESVAFEDEWSAIDASMRLTWRIAPGDFTFG